MQISEQRHGAVTILAPQGPLVGPDAEAFRTGALDALARSQGRFVFDATGVPYADSKGLEALLDLTDQISTSGSALKLCGAGDTLREVLQLTEVFPLLEHFDDVNAAVRSFL
ncbi:hypothetical protein BH11PLA1_BH11PLA1_12240 [soil metagenome]